MKTKISTPLEMDFTEFINWATGHVLLGMGQGTSLRTLIDEVVDHVSRNNNFGGLK